MHLGNLKWSLLLIVPILVGSAMGAEAQGKSIEAIWGISPPMAEDLNPAPKTVEVELVARVERVKFGNSQWTEVWTYNGSTPGPTIEANVGDTVCLTAERVRCYPEGV